LLALVTAELGHGGVAHTESGVSHWALFAAMQVTLGPIVGIVVGFCGGKVISWAAKTQWMNHTFQDLSLIALSFLAFGLAETIGGNGFIAAFCAGLTLGNTAQNLCKCLYEFAEAEGQLLTLSVFLLLGSVILPQFKAASLALVFLYAILSLTVFRMIPVSLSLLGSKLKPQSHLFLGWFGPRGLASILFALLMLEELHSPVTELLFSIILATVFLSVFLHGITAGPLAKIYSRSINQETKHAEEHLKIDEMPVKNIGAPIG
jgi:sodium/hydrogen antiporter